MIPYVCPRCEKELSKRVLTSKPPIHMMECECGFSIKLQDYEKIYKLGRKKGCNEIVYGVRLLQMMPRIEGMLEFDFAGHEDTVEVKRKAMYDFLFELHDAISEETHPSYQMNEKRKFMSTPAQDVVDAVNEQKPPLGCAPYYVSISARICELCEAIKRYSTESGKCNNIKLWTEEIYSLNEMKRHLDWKSKTKTWAEKKDGTLEEMK